MFLWSKPLHISQIHWVFCLIFAGIKTKTNQSSLYSTVFFKILKEPVQVQKPTKPHTAWLVRFLWMSEAGRQPYRSNFGLKPTWLKRKCLKFFCEVIRLAKFWVLQSFLRQNWQWRQCFAHSRAAGGSCFCYG